MFQIKKGKISKIILSTQRFRLEPKHCNPISDFLKDLLTSSLITVLIYFVLFLFISFFINFNLFTDPSQEIQNLNICLNEEKIESSDLIELSSKIVQVLSEQNQKYFLCYRSLIYILKVNVRTYDKNFLDLCIYDSNSTAHDIKSNIHYSFGYSNLAIVWSDLEKHDSEFSHEFNSFYGYYKLSYRTAEVYLYMFIKAPSTRLEFESMTRSGILYTQFDHVIKKLYSSSKEVNSRNRVSLLNRIPSYMVDEMVFKVNISSSYIYLPVDPFNLIMYFYPNIWQLPILDDSINKCTF
ncbi:hypothetical protein BpHYR1_043286 [Brachionus plicatilis]|uniref:Uncharacterized protein n=1 Tax=Brachionus plicatilis TaxID=10195 RepID=A0A3M7PJI2_BRAPC|nr:hypothetical protein BpHYR1_043286 [Brachionus plicatilis]